MPQVAVNMNVIAFMKVGRKLKIWSFKMPKISYCHRYGALKKGVL